ncbi:MAG: hypothetical protein ACRDY7_17660, partial [Acidimicrobiia bacterium]
MRRFMILMSLLCLVAAGCGSRRTPEEAAAIRASRAGAVQAPGPEAGTAGSESDSAAPSAAPASETETGVAAPAPSAP